MNDQKEHVYHLKIDSAGRIVIPAEVRRRSHLEGGGTVVVVEKPDGLHLTSLSQALADAQAYFAALAPAEVILSDEINAERRAETERD